MEVPVAFPSLEIGHTFDFGFHAGAAGSNAELLDSHEIRPSMSGMRLHSRS